MRNQGVKVKRRSQLSLRHLCIDGVQGDGADGRVCLIPLQGALVVQSAQHLDQLLPGHEGQSCLRLAQLVQQHTRRHLRALRACHMIYY